MADDFVSSAADTSERKTYRHAKAATVGEHDAQLAPTNMGRWGYRGRALDSPARMMYWHLAERSVRCWEGAERCLVNVSDSLDGDRQVPVVREWERLLGRNGWSVDARHEVATRRYRNGANGNRRAGAEVILDCSRW